MTTYEDTHGADRTRGGPGWAVRLLAWVCILFGLVICAGGIWLLLIEVATWVIRSGTDRQIRLGGDAVISQIVRVGVRSGAAGEEEGDAASPPDLGRRRPSRDDSARLTAELAKELDSPLLPAA